MYRLGERENHHRKVYILLAVFVVMIAGLGFAAKQFFTADTQISNTATATITNVTYEQTKLRTIDEPSFTMTIPASWKLSSMYAEVPKPTYIFQGTVGEDKNRWISVFVDTPLPSFAVNRALRIQSNGPQISVIGSVSDNCTSFTGAASTQTGKSPAKWETIDFICDSGNYERDVVGVVSPDGLNNVNVASTVRGSHKYFFTYTDNSDQHDYSTFTESLKSFKAK
ncbi:hypothetical protein H7097_04365 [Aeromicrobium sp.]|nr:hypothetical protein [Candidatus Saccharibacteria bacterium]